VKAADLFSLPESLAMFRSFFDPEAAPWAWLRQIGIALQSPVFGSQPEDVPPGLLIEGPVFVHPSARLPHIGTLIGPIWIGPETKLLPGCFLRGNVIVGARCIIGHNAEIKNSLLMDDVHVPHRPYIGDSILGNSSHLGAGVVLSNLRLDQKNIIVRAPGESSVDSGLRKFGALLGDGAEVGCNTVLNPGTIIGKNSFVTPSLVVGGVIPGDTILHAKTTLSLIPRRR
jgi:NDP-sugar pyrophosphorylase family protein